MLNYCKTILSKVSFHKELFEKELKKAIALLIPDEITALRDWCYETFKNYLSILNNCFSTSK